MRPRAMCQTVPNISHAPTRTGPRRSSSTRQRHAAPCVCTSGSRTAPLPTQLETSYPTRLHVCAQLRTVEALREGRRMKGCRGRVASSPPLWATRGAARCDAPANQACGSYSWSYCHVFSDALSTSKPVCTRSVTLPWRDTCPPCVSTPLGTRDLLLASPATGAHNALRTACSTPRGTSYGECEARTRHPPLSHRRGPHPGNPTPRLLYPRHANFAATPLSVDRLET